MTADVGAADLARAVAVVAGSDPETVAAAAGADWDGLRAWAADASGRLLPPERLGLGVEAFQAGFLVGAQLAEGRRGLDGAVALVQERGRHAVIAERCDLAGVADVERVYAESFAEGVELRDGERDALTRLFETGLAVGLAL